MISANDLGERLKRKEMESAASVLSLIFYSRKSRTFFLNVSSRPICDFHAKEISASNHFHSSPRDPVARVSAAKPPHKPAVGVL